MPRRSRKAENVVQVALRGGPFKGTDRRVMRRRAEKMLRHLELCGVELSIALVDDETIRELNRTYRSIDRATDVLAFPMDEDEPAPKAARMLGDVVISIPTARRQAGRHRRRLLDELTMLLAHGLLHLLGHDHADDDQERAMKTLTDELAAAAGARR